MIIMSLMMMTTTLMKIMMICSLFNLDFNKSVLTFQMHLNVFSIMYKMHTYINWIYVWKRTVVKTSLNTRNKNKRSEKRLFRTSHFE
jgi:hypothetical protein